MNLADISGWIGNVLFIIGAIYLARGRAYVCAVANVFANICYIVNSIALYNEPLIILSIGLIAVNIWAIFTWRKKEATVRSGTQQGS